MCVCLINNNCFHKNIFVYFLYVNTVQQYKLSTLEYIHKLIKFLKLIVFNILETKYVYMNIVNVYMKICCINKNIIKYILFY